MVRCRGGMPRKCLGGSLSAAWGSTRGCMCRGLLLASRVGLRAHVWVCLWVCLHSGFSMFARWCRGHGGGWLFMTVVVVLLGGVSCMERARTVGRACESRRQCLACVTSHQRGVSNAGAWPQSLRALPPVVHVWPARHAAAVRVRVARAAAARQLRQTRNAQGCAAV